MFAVPSDYGFHELFPFRDAGVMIVAGARHSAKLTA
jgi:hypothetical protein